MNGGMHHQKISCFANINGFKEKNMWVRWRWHMTQKVVQRTATVTSIPDAPCGGSPTTLGVCIQVVAGGGEAQMRFSQKPKFYPFFEAFPYRGSQVQWSQYPQFNVQGVSCSSYLALFRTTTLHWRSNKMRKNGEFENGEIPGETLSLTNILDPTRCRENLTEFKNAKKHEDTWFLQNTLWTLGLFVYFCKSPKMERTSHGWDGVWTYRVSPKKGD